MRRRLRELLSRPVCHVMPGVFECIGARAAEQVGFSLLSVTGNGLSASLLGVPDLGLITLTEMAEGAGRIASAVSIPVIADADTGFGNAVNTVRTTQIFEQSGVAGIHLEDQVSPKQCAYYAGGRGLVSVREHALKIQAAADAREDPDFCIIARTDALRSEGMIGVLERMEAYEAAGADAHFVVGVENLEQIEALRGKTTRPLILNTNDGGPLSHYTPEELAEAGANVIMYPATVRSAVLRAALQTLEELHAAGRSESSPALATLEEFNEMIGLEEYRSLEECYLAGP